MSELISYIVSNFGRAEAKCDAGKHSNINQMPKVDDTKFLI